MNARYKQSIRIESHASDDMLVDVLDNFSKEKNLWPGIVTHV